MMGGDKRIIMFAMNFDQFFFRNAALGEKKDIKLRVEEAISYEVVVCWMQNFCFFKVPVLGEFRKDDLSDGVLPVHIGVPANIYQGFRVLLTQCLKSVVKFDYFFSEGNIMSRGGKINRDMNGSRKTRIGEDKWEKTRGCKVQTWSYELVKMLSPEDHCSAFCLGFDKRKFWIRNIIRTQ